MGGKSSLICMGVDELSGLGGCGGGIFEGVGVCSGVWVDVLSGLGGWEGGLCNGVGESSGVWVSGGAGVGGWGVGGWISCVTVGGEQHVRVALRCACRHTWQIQKLFSCSQSGGGNSGGDLPRWLLMWYSKSSSLRLGGQRRESGHAKGFGE